MTQEQLDAAFHSRAFIDRPADCQKICDIVRAKLGLTMSPLQAQTFWQWRSDRASAGWLIVDTYSEDDIVMYLEWFADREYDHC